MFSLTFELLQLNCTTVNTPWKQYFWPVPGKIHYCPLGKNRRTQAVLLFTVQIVKIDGPIFLISFKRFVH